MVSKDCPLIFTHIPKTGGMSLFAAMCQYHGMKMADMYNIPARDIDKAPIEELLSDQEKVSLQDIFRSACMNGYRALPATWR
jgi:hypothetical protein